MNRIKHKILFLAFTKSIINGIDFDFYKIITRVEVMLVKRFISESIKNKIISNILNDNSCKIYAIYIFGSYGTKYKRDDSDIDIAIITDTKYKISERYKLKEKLSNDLGIEVDLAILHDYNSNLMLEILSQAYLIYESDDYCYIFDDIYEKREFELYFMENYLEEIKRYFIYVD